MVNDLAAAQQLITQGRITVGGAMANNAERQVAADEAIEILALPNRFVSRGGEKLEAALKQFEVTVERRRAIDVGASTGGFTDCLLQHGATKVTAIDVGYGQLHERLRDDPRVRNYERTTLRDLDVASVGGPADVVVADLSFISLRLVAADLERLGTANAVWLILVKPQFEAERQEADRGRGVIRDPAIWERVLHEVKSTFAGYGLFVGGAMVSPITGKDGNTEFLVKLTRSETFLGDQHIESAVASAKASTSTPLPAEGV